MDLVVIGAGKFALEVTGYIDDVVLEGAARAYRVVSYLSLAGEPVFTPADRTVPLTDFDQRADVSVVLAVSDVDERRSLIDGFINKHGLIGANILHPNSRVDRTRIEGVGNIVGPDCHLGANVSMGSYNVVNYHCTVGHHSTLGTNNFMAPNFNCGNTVKIGDHNMFGLSCTLAPEITVGDFCRFQAGITMFENAMSGYSYLSPSRIRPIKLHEGESQ